jgi:glucan phosphoethanolaminetransferase (alkaline phosphatase superfamily)
VRESPDADEDRRLSPIQFAAIAFACIIASAVGGALLRARLPEAHVSGDSKDVIKLSIALVATMSALVLALLFASTRTSFERTSGLVSRMTADIVELDRVLKHYGPDAEAIRAALRAEIQPIIDSIWRDEAIARGAKLDASKAPDEEVMFMLQDLQPANSKQRALQTRAIQISTDLQQTQLALFAQPTDSISNTFLIVLIVWLMFIFGIFSMTAPPNPTLFIVIAMCILSASAAFYLILELGLPFGGLMQLSNEPLRNALK